jgi:hypothetical protein
MKLKWNIYKTEKYITMNKIYIFIIVPLLLFCQLASGQDREARQKIESARIALITDRLGLTPEQAERFWPIYNEYNNHRRNLVQELQEARGKVDMQNLSEEQGQALMKLGMDIKERQLQLEKTYAQRLNQVITTQQILSLRKAEEDFRRMIIQRLEERTDDQPQGGIIEKQRE